MVPIFFWIAETTNFCVKKFTADIIESNVDIFNMNNEKYSAKNSRDLKDTTNDRHLLWSNSINH